MQYLRFSSLPLFQAWAWYPRWYPSPSPGLPWTAVGLALHAAHPGTSVLGGSEISQGRGRRGRLDMWKKGEPKLFLLLSSLWGVAHTTQPTVTSLPTEGLWSLGSRNINSFLCPSRQGLTLASCHPVSGSAPHLLPDFSAIPSPAWPTLMTHSVNFETTLQNPFQLSWESCQVSSPVIAKRSHPSQKNISLSL